MVLGIEFSSHRDAMFFNFCIEKYCPKFENEPSMTTVRRQHEFQKFKDELKALNGKYDFISRPMSFKKSGVSWFDPTTNTFIIDEIPDEIKNIIKQIGFKKKDLQKPEKAKPLYDII